MTLDLAHIQAALDRPPRRLRPEDGRRAAVAAIVDDSLALLFMRRAAHPEDPWSGHLAFPGGREEPDDPDLQHTAVRETLEEVGLDLRRHGTLLGELDEIQTVGQLPPLVIRPYVFHVPRLPELTPNYEVASLHRLSIPRLLTGEGRGTMHLEHLGHRRTLARVDFDGVRLWGLTLAMVDDLLHRLDEGGRGLRRLG